LMKDPIKLSPDEDPWSWGPDARPKTIGSWCRTHYPWVLMQDPSELGPETGRIRLGSWGRIQSIGSWCRTHYYWVLA
jgi:hypothetical protein